MEKQKENYYLKVAGKSTVIWRNISIMNVARAKLLVLTHYAIFPKFYLKFFEDGALLL